jgi:hypothetical protein
VASLDRPCRFSESKHCQYGNAHSPGGAIRYFSRFLSISLDRSLPVKVTAAVDSSDCPMILGSLRVVLCGFTFLGKDAGARG